MVLTESRTGISIGGSSSLTLTDDAIVSNNRDTGIILSGGTLTMLGNSLVSGNGKEAGSGGLNGSGIYIQNNSALVMKENSKIDGNTATNGGGVRIDRMDYADLPPVLAMEGNATISNNTAKQNGGGIWFSYGTRLGKQATTKKEPLTITGNATISGNKAKNGGGIYLNYGIGVYPFILIGGKITANKADYGAGVYFSGESPKGYFNVPEPSSESFILQGGSIEKNNAEFVGGGLYLATGSKYIKKTGSITGNTAGDGEGEDVFIQE